MCNSYRVGFEAHLKQLMEIFSIGISLTLGSFKNLYSLATHSAASRTGCALRA